MIMSAQFKAWDLTEAFEITQAEVRLIRRLSKLRVVPQYLYPPAGLADSAPEPFTLQLSDCLDQCLQAEQYKLGPG